ncbi:MAG: hypothetical protein LBH43_15660 [Treponema sp.]|nr:hypothetical protein [Treponema sp.]
MTWLCAICGEAVFAGRYVNYECPPGSGYTKQDITGEFEAGSGQCEECGKLFCAECNELANNLCPECYEEKDTGFIPF